MRKIISAVVVTRNRLGEATECIKSLFKQTHPIDEIIVVDNASSDETGAEIKKLFPKVKLVTSNKNLGGAGGRNLGYRKTKGDLILFMDDDALADKELVYSLLETFESAKNIGIVQPKIYDKEQKDIIQGVGHGINLLTGRVYGIGVREKDKGQFDKDMEVPMVGCCWMVRKAVFQKIGQYDEEIFIPYEDSDFCKRAWDAGFKVMYSYKAKVWHRGPKDTGIPAKLQWIGITTSDRAYRVSRNKMIFMKKHAPKINLIIFGVFLVPIYAVVHSAIIVSSRRFNILLNYWKGIFSGYFYLFK